MVQGRQKELLSIFDRPTVSQYLDVNVNSWSYTRIKFILLKHECRWEELRKLSLATLSSTSSSTMLGHSDQESTVHDLIIFRSLLESCRHNTVGYGHNSHNITLP